MRQFTLFIGLLLATAMGLHAQGSLEGTVTDKESGEPIIIGTVALLKEGIPVTGTDTDFNGYYNFNGLNPGTYDVEVSYVGYKTQRMEGVLIIGGKTVEVNLEIEPGVTLTTVEIIEYKAPLFEKDQTGGGRTVTSENIRQIATRNVNTIAATAGGVASIDGQDLNIRGARSEATNYYVDGVRVSANLIPDSEIEQLQTLTGGLDAKYGDVTGGVISITTKGPANKFRASLEAETSNPLDEFDRTLARASLSGPILKNKETDKTILGYRVSGQYVNQKYPYRYVGHYIFPENTISDLEGNPLFLVGNSQISRGETFDNAFLTRQTPNEQSTSLTGTARLDLRVSDAINLSLTGAYRGRNFNFVPGAGSTVFGANSGAWRHLNYDRNPFGEDESLRASFRLRHRIGGSGLSSEGEAASSALVRNVSYSIQLGFERNSQLRQDKIHEDRFFDYGYVGTFETQTRPNFAPIGFDPDIGQPIFAHVDYQDTLLNYTPGGFNPAIENYNQYRDPENVDAPFLAQNGLLTIPSVWNGFLSPAGNVYNRWINNEQDRYTLNIESNFDLFPGGSDKGRHNIEFGLMYEQRVERGYSISPFSLWLRADQFANVNINGIDTTDIIGTEIIGLDTVDIYNTLLTDDLNDDSKFYKSIRERFGLDEHDIVNVSNYRPEDMSLDMFSAFELTSVGSVGYTGYDYLGNRAGSEASFEGFFKDRNPDGSLSMIVPANRPIYTGVYLQDRFSYKDLIFKLGVRVDRYDANTRVLRDPFSLYEIQSAEDFFAEVGEVRPENIGADYKVYTFEAGGDRVRAYRDGDQWYTPEGTPVNDGIQIFGQEVVNPKFTSEDNDIRDIEYDLNKSFEDFEPVLNWMPRIAFSFPISEEANFFAHYDVTYQRPINQSFVSPLTYFFIEQNSFGAGSPLNNSSLTSEKTTDFEVGFQQKISQNSALRVSALYREFQDQIQARFYNFTDGIGNSSQYFGFDNIDVSTVKGLNFRYDLRRVKNLELFLSYSLQFAEGTGSSSTSQLALVSGGQNINEIFPLSFDERHQINLSLDYRYGSGKRYNGPRIGGKPILANFGVNVLTQAISGRPFTKQQVPDQFGGSGFEGGLNEARYPFRFNVDLQVNKTFRLNPNAEDGKKPLNLDVFFRALNLLNTENIIGWYRASLSDTDDGYLLTERGQSIFQNIVDDPLRDENIWLQARQWRLVNNGFYALPRRMFIGAAIQF